MKLKLSIFFGFLSLYCTCLFGQISSEVLHPYYFNFNLSKDQVYTLSTSKVNIKYQDFLADNNPLELSVFDWRGKPLRSYSLSKSFGINYYTVDLMNLFEEWLEGEVYRFEIKDGLNKSRILVRKIEIVKENVPVANIVVSPILLDCEIPNVSSIEFYAEISGGKAPFEVSWVVMNEDQTSLLYQPKQDKVEIAGKSSFIRVDADPNYKVMLLVTDACGNYVEQTVLIDCQKGKKKANNFTLEPLTGKKKG